MSDLIKVELSDDFDVLDEGYEFRVEDDELTTWDEMVEMKLDEREFVEVKINDMTYFVRKETVEDIVKRLP